MAKTILITGGNSGIGKAAAEALAKEGHRLIITGRRKGLLEEVAASLNTPCHALSMDVQDRDAVKAAIASIPPEFADIDVLVNNAGLALGLESADKASMADWEVMVETNILGLLAVTKQILPGMKQRGAGHIVNISSTAGNYQYPGANVYGASKAFVSYFSLAMRADLLGEEIRVTNIEPGMVETDFSKIRFKGDEERAAGVYAGTKPLTAGDVAETIRWAISLPPHVNINRIELMPTCQAPGGPVVHRKN